MSALAQLYANAVQAGRRDIKSVPAKIKDEVEAILKGSK